MTLDELIMGGGAFVALLPFLSFPSSWEDVLLFLAGVFIVALGIVVRRRASHRVHEPSPKPSPRQEDGYAPQ